MSAMNAGAELRATVDLHAPADDVWAALVDWEAQARWMLGTTVRHTGGPAAGVGTELEARTGWGPLAVVDSMVVTGWEPPRRCEVLHHGALVGGDGGFVVQPAPDRKGAQLTWWERFTLPAGLVGRLGWRLVAPAVRWGLRSSLRRFALLVESQGTR